MDTNSLYGIKLSSFLSSQKQPDDQAGHTGGTGAKRSGPLSGDAAAYLRGKSTVKRIPRELDGNYAVASQKPKEVKTGSTPLAASPASARPFAAAPAAMRSVPTSPPAKSPDLSQLAERYVDQYQQGTKQVLNQDERAAMIKSVVDFYSVPSRVGRLEKLLAN